MRIYFLIDYFLRVIDLSDEVPLSFEQSAIVVDGSASF